MPGYFAHKHFIGYSTGPSDVGLVSNEWSITSGLDDMPSLDLLPPDTRWVVYDYTEQGYDGHGVALIALTDGTFILDDIGHNSTYGPFERLDYTDTRLRLSLLDIEHCFGKDPNGHVLRPGEWDVASYQRLWEGVIIAGFFEPTRDNLRVILASDNKSVREYAIKNILPALAAKAQNPTPGPSRKA